jgi:hypothetical protein
MSALSRPDCGSAGGELSTLIDSAGRWGTLDTTNPVSGAVVGPLDEDDLLLLEQLAARVAAASRAAPSDTFGRCRRRETGEGAATSTRTD